MKRRSYRQNCALAEAADLLGERWTLLILRELLIRPRRFGELARALNGIGSNLLAVRLQALQSAGIVKKIDADDKRSPYALTRAGRAVEPLVFELIRWGYRFGTGSRDYAHEDHWDLLAMRAFFSSERCKRPLVVQFSDDDFEAWVRVSPEGFEHGFGRAPSVDLEIPTTIARFQADTAAGRYRDDAIARDFTACFVVPVRVKANNVA